MNIRLVVLFSLFIFSALGLWSCSLLLSPNDKYVLNLENQTGEPLVYDIWELETSHRVDPNPEFTVNPDQDRLLPPGQSVHIRAEDMQGDYEIGNSLRIFLWKVQDNTAMFTEILTLSHEELLQLDCQIELSKFMTTKNSPRITSKRCLRHTNDHELINTNIVFPGVNYSSPLNDHRRNKHQPSGWCL